MTLLNAYIINSAKNYHAVESIIMCTKAQLLLPVALHWKEVTLHHRSITLRIFMLLLDMVPTRISSPQCRNKFEHSGPQLANINRGIGEKPSLVFALRTAKLPKNAPSVFVSTEFMYWTYGMPILHDCKDAGGRATQESKPRTTIWI